MSKEAVRSGHSASENAAPLVVCATHEAFLPRAEKLAARLDVPLVPWPPKEHSASVQKGLAILVGEQGLALSDGNMSIKADFTQMLPRISPARLPKELLVRAAKLRQLDGQPHAVDATAGLGEDAFLLAAAGFELTLYESNPVIASLLEDALDRAASDPQIAKVAKRMSLIHANSLDALPRLERVPDVVLLDPMFPTRQKSAAVKKKLQLLQRLEQPCEDEGALLDAALSSRARKVIVKRPAKGPWLAGRKPSHTLSGKAVRFDCYIP